MDIEKSLFSIEYIGQQQQQSSIFHQTGFGSLCTQTFELKDPFYVLSVDEIFRIYDLQEQLPSTLLAKYDTNYLTQMHFFYSTDPVASNIPNNSPTPTTPAKSTNPISFA